jgi:hypothetical protein
MSVVTGVVICTSCAEDIAIFAGINHWLANNGGGWDLAMVDSHAGGRKRPQMHIAAGGFNYFPNDVFLAWFKTIGWEYPENVILIMNPEDGPTIVWRPASFLE